MWVMMLGAFAGFQVADHGLADLDGDGGDERIIAGFTSDGSIRVNVIEADGHVTTLNLGPRMDINGPRDQLSLDLTTAEETGVPLAHVFIPGGEYCGSGDRHIYLAYTHDGPRTQLSNALEYGSFSDAPVWSYTEAEFHPDRKMVELRGESGDGELVTLKSHELLTFRDGAFMR